MITQPPTPVAAVSRPARRRRLRAALAVGAALAMLATPACSSSGDQGAEASATPTPPQATATPVPDDGGSGDDGGASATPTPLPTPTTVPTPSPTPLPPLQGLAAELVVDGLDQPIFVTGAPGTDALFVVEREGVIRVVEDGVLRDEPFVDLTDDIWSYSIEQGLLGLAFHPDYENNGRVFLYWTEYDNDSQLGEMRASDPTHADPDSRRVLLEIDQPAERHNAGMIVFGPDGLLYLSLGDGATGGRPSQDTSSPLGSILRLDIDSRSPYAIPDANPYGNEVWLHGFRNPWRFSIDPVDEVVYIGDVGQVTIEEINAVPLDTVSANFGWPEMEGSSCQGARRCTTEGMTTPVAQYDHDEGCSVTGGYVYRGPAIPELQGHYLYADWCTGLVRSLRLVDGVAVDEADWSDDLDPGQVTSFGVDNTGELYMTNWDGQLMRIVPVR